MKWVNYYIGLGLLFSTLLIFVGCGSSEEEPVDPSTLNQNESITIADEVEEVVDAVLEAVGKSEEVEEVEEATADLTDAEQRLIDELTQMGAEKYGVSVETYISGLKDQGLTPYTAQKQLADTMGISLEELHAYETSTRGQLSDEQLENNEAMANALEEVGDMDLSSMEGLTAEAILGMKTNESGEIISLEGDVEELFSYKIKEIISIYDDDYSYAVDYYTSGTMEETVKYFDDLLNQTEEYFYLGQDLHVGVYVTGTVNGMLVTVAIEPQEENLDVTFYVDKTTKD